MFWDRFYITDEGQVFTDNDETGQSAEEVYQAWLELKENPPKPKPTQVELLQAQIEELQKEKALLETPRTVSGILRSPLSPVQPENA